VTTGGIRCSRYWRKIQPSRIAAFNQLNLLLSTPTFQLFLPSNRRSDVVRRLEVHQSRHAVSRGELNFAPSMLMQAQQEVVRDSYIETV
jgi:hypothetical protein